MEEFEIPVVHLYTPLDAAFLAMQEAGKSGVLAQAGPQFRLLRFDAIQHALDTGKHSLAEVEEFEWVQRVSPSEATVRGLNLTDPHASESQFNAFLDEVQCSFGVIDVTLGMATLVSRHETKASGYIPSPSIVKCQNPRTPHYYPPNQKPPGQQTCVLCSYALP